MQENDKSKNKKPIPENYSKFFDSILDELEDLGKTIGVQIKMQSEDIFNIMHRI